MHIALIGATGFVGSAVLEELLTRGHQVRALQRNPASLATRPGLTVQAADALAPQGLRAALEGVDAVVSAYNAGWGNPKLYDDFLQGSEAITAAARAAAVRLLVVGGAGSLYVAPGQQLVDSPQFPAEWKAGALAARELLRRLQADASGLDWSFVSPPMHLERGERTGHYRLGTDTPVFDAEGHCRLSVADLAVAIVDEIERPAHQRQRFTAAY
jgi:putative NADH-flavin reductase